MANEKITEMDPAATPLDHTEIIELVQNGDNVQAPISEIGRNLQYVTFNTAPTPGAHETGKLYWDADAGTMAFMTDVTDVVLQVGQEIYVKVRNNTGSLIANGKPVRITGAIGNRPTIALAQADTAQNARVIGVATEDIANNADGYITAFGLVRDFDTSSFSVGDDLYLSQTVAGEFVNVEPGSGIVVICGVVIVSNATNGIFLARIIF